MKKILFNEFFELNRMVLEGKKTMTRRIMKRQPSIIRHYNPLLFEDVNARYAFFEDERGKCVLLDEQQYIILPKFKIGDVVAIAQSYSSIFDEAMIRNYWDDCYESFRQAQVDDKPGWSNKLFVKAELMPHLIKITDIKAERLQDISDEDCLREGVYHYTSYRPDCFSWGNSWHCFETPREAFVELTDKICGKGTWVSNPFCFAYDFELIR